MSFTIARCICLLVWREKNKEYHACNPWVLSKPAEGDKVELAISRKASSYVTRRCCQRVRNSFFSIGSSKDMNTPIIGQCNVWHCPLTACMEHDLSRPEVSWAVSQVFTLPCTNAEWRLWKHGEIPEGRLNKRGNCCMWRVHHMTVSTWYHKFIRFNYFYDNFFKFLGLY